MQRGVATTSLVMNQVLLLSMTVKRTDNRAKIIKQAKSEIERLFQTNRDTRPIKSIHTRPTIYGFDPFLRVGEGLSFLAGLTWHM
mmetsp:Transcript_53769/g.89440  ORF Transcript_53769/g.89440 Transcript_53769/m.89440 type:complete len:85 (+) Transcript_53769:387-641(+)